MTACTRRQAPSRKGRRSPEILEMLARSESRVCPARVGLHTERPADCCRILPHLVAVHNHSALHRTDQPAYHPESWSCLPRSGLAARLCAVGAVKTHPVYSPDLSVMLHEIPHLDQPLPPSFPVRARFRPYAPITLFRCFRPAAQNSSTGVIRHAPYRRRHHSDALYNHFLLYDFRTGRITSAPHLHVR